MLSLSLKRYYCFAFVVFAFGILALGFWRWDFGVGISALGRGVELFALGFLRWAFRAGFFLAWLLFVCVRLLVFLSCVIGFCTSGFCVWVCWCLSFGVDVLALRYCFRFCFFCVGLQPGVCFCWALSCRCALGFGL